MGQSKTTAEDVALLEGQVQCRVCGQIRNLQLLIRENGLVLRGQARTYYAKQLAQHAAMSATELPILANEIQVSPPKETS